MDKKLLFAIATLVLLGGAYASYLFLQQDHTRSATGLEINTPAIPLPKPE